MKYMRFPIFMAIMPLLSACATWSGHGVEVSSDNRFRIAVVPIYVTADIGDVSEIMSQPPQIDDEKSFIRTQMREVANQLTASLQSKLGESTFIKMVTDAEHILKKDAFAAESLSDEAITELRRLRQTNKVQAVLTVSLAGYGALKQEWLTFLIGTGVAEGVVQGVVAAKVVANPWVGLAVGLEEIGQEILEWGGGSYLFDSYYSPVTLEARLISTQDGVAVYDDTVFVSIDNDAIKTLSKQDQNKRELHLLLTAKKAVSELVADINQVAQRNAHGTGTSDNQVQ